MAERKRLQHADGIFRTLYEQRYGSPVDLSDLSPDDYDAELLEHARVHWKERTRTEFRSIQIMTRFVEEVVGAGDPIEVYAGALELVEDEIHHTHLCASVCERLGVDPWLPDPVRLEDPERFLRAPMPERALTTAISMLAINETISAGFVRDLRDRCHNPPVRRVLDATIEDEAGHEEFGWRYIAESLRRFPSSTLPDWRHLVETTLQPHRRNAERVLAEVPEDQRRLEAWPDRDRIALGLFSPQRQALVYQRTWEHTLRPKLAELDLL